MRASGILFAARGSPGSQASSKFRNTATGGAIRGSRGPRGGLAPEAGSCARRYGSWSVRGRRARAGRGGKGGVQEGRQAQGFSQAAGASRRRGIMPPATGCASLGSGALQPQRLRSVIRRRAVRAWCLGPLRQRLSPTARRPLRGSLCDNAKLPKGEQTFACVGQGPPLCRRKDVTLDWTQRIQRGAAPQSSHTSLMGGAITVCSRGRQRRAAPSGRAKGLTTKSLHNTQGPAATRRDGRIARAGRESAFSPPYRLALSFSSIASHGAEWVECCSIAPFSRRLRPLGPALAADDHPCK